MCGDHRSTTARSTGAGPSKLYNYKFSFMCLYYILYIYVYGIFFESRTIYNTQDGGHTQEGASYHHRSVSRKHAYGADCRRVVSSSLLSSRIVIGIVCRIGDSAADRPSTDTCILRKRIRRRALHASYILDDLYTVCERWSTLNSIQSRFDAWMIFVSFGTPQNKIYRIIIGRLRGDTYIANTMRLARGSS